jgi:hypothetical protein
VMVADPALMPLTCAGVAGDSVPPAMKTLSVTVTFEVSLLVSVTVTPPAGAGAGKSIASTADCPNVTVVLAGRRMAADDVMVTPAVALEILVALAVIVADPAATPVTGTATLVVFAPKLTVGGALATPALLELRLIVNPPPGAGADRISVRFCVAVPVIVRLAGEKLMVIPAAVPEVTCTLAGGNPLADAVMIADPALTPLTVAARLIDVAPCGMKMLSGATVTFEGSLLASEINTPSAGAGVANDTGNGADWPGTTVTLAGRMICWA